MFIPKVDSENRRYLEGFSNENNAALISTTKAAPFSKRIIESADRGQALTALQNKPWGCAVIYPSSRGPKTFSAFVKTPDLNRLTESPITLHPFVTLNNAKARLEKEMSDIPLFSRSEKIKQQFDISSVEYAFEVTKSTQGDALYFEFAHKPNAFIDSFRDSGPSGVISSTCSYYKFQLVAIEQEWALISSIISLIESYNFNSLKDAEEFLKKDFKESLAKIPEYLRSFCKPVVFYKEKEQTFQVTLGKDGIEITSQLVSEESLKVLYQRETFLANEWRRCLALPQLMMVEYQAIYEKYQANLSSLIVKGVVKAFTCCGTFDELMSIQNQILLRQSVLCPNGMKVKRISKITDQNNATVSVIQLDKIFC